MKRRAVIFVLWLLGLTATAQPVCHVLKYDESDGVPSSHLTQLLQDNKGFMWFSTWNGLCRYDGYEFQTFKPQVGDGCNMKTDRIRNINLLPQGLILCQVDEDYYMFDLSTYRFRNLTSQERQQAEEYRHKYRQSRSMQNREHFSWTDAHHTQWSLDGKGRLTYQTSDDLETEYPLNIPFNRLSFAFPDNSGNLWVLDNGCIYQFCTDVRRTQRLDIIPKAEVKSLFLDSKGRYWVATKGDKAVRVYRSIDDSLLGYLGSDGRLHPKYTSFSSAVYCMYESKDGTLWFGTKPQGLYRLQETSPNTFEISHFIEELHHDIYHLKADRWGRLWVATLDGGLCYLTGIKDKMPHYAVPKHYPKEKSTRARYLYISDDDILLVATSNGLMVSQLKENADEMGFILHERESERESSLSSSATMDVVQDGRGQIFVSTESGGINLIQSKDLLAENLKFRHFNEIFQAQSNDIVQSLTPLGQGMLMAVGSHLITLLDSTYHGRVLDARYFNENYRFSEAHPIRIDGNRWLFGLTDGAFIADSQKLLDTSKIPKLVLTHVSVQGGNSNWAIEQADTLTLMPNERSVTIHFAALEYSSPERINYAFRLSSGEEWNYLGHNRSATLLDLEKGNYVLEIRSTNASGEWQDNVRRLTIIVEPTFWEAWYGQLLLVLLIVGVLATVAYTYLYIRRIKRKHRETLEKYLALIEVSSTSVETNSLPPSDQSDAVQELDPTLQRVMQYIEENISNSDVGVGEMAAAAAVSRSGLQRKLKQTMGVTPQELLSKARIKHACLLLQQTSKSVSDVAYACGFNDPKYFSRCFKQSIGKSPTEYKNASN